MRTIPLNTRRQTCAEPRAAAQAASRLTVSAVSVGPVAAANIHGLVRGAAVAEEAAWDNERVLAAALRPIEGEALGGLQPGAVDVWVPARLLIVVRLAASGGRANSKRPAN